MDAAAGNDPSQQTKGSGARSFLKCDRCRQNHKKVRSSSNTYLTDCRSVRSQRNPSDGFSACRYDDTGLEYLAPSAKKRVRAVDHHCIIRIPQCQL
jgi:hypothetical protein